MEGNNNLKDTMAKIEEIYGFKASPRGWKNMMEEWGWKKNLPKCDMQWMVDKEMTRAQGGKDTTFFHGETEVSARRIANFKRRKTREEPTSMSTPPNVTYNTPPNLDSEQEDSVEQDLIEQLPFEQLSIEQHSIEGYTGIVSDLSTTQASLVRPPCSQNENNPTGTVEPLRKSPIRPMLDEYLSNKDDFWTLLCHINERRLLDPLLGKQIPSVRQRVESEVCNDQHPSDDLFGAGGWFDVSSFAAMDREGEVASADIEAEVQKLLLRFSHHLQSNSKAVFNADTVFDAVVEQYLRSNYPTRFGPNTDMSQSGWLSGATDADPIQLDEDLRSTDSSSAGVSHKYGKTYSSGAISGISDSFFMHDG
ncbi:hypothetical protein V493_02149 [Pseudogymnoascus sp. VKM F-4281 (FW-2241)]|nr:hypothetical protein V493_02149 [Pseudogymnoascus sp. VKM F-4281 (FW-2241)]